MLISVVCFVCETVFDYIILGTLPAISFDYLWYFIIEIFTSGSPVSLSEALWFVISLFFVLVVYVFLKKVFYKIWNSYIMLILFCILNCFVVYLVKKNDLESYYFFLLPLKCLFFLPFIEMGVVYRDHLEKRHTDLSASKKCLLLILLIVINLIRQIFLSGAYDIAFNGLSTLSGFKSPYLVTPLISSIIGILFWLTVIDLIGDALFDSKLLNYISDSTYWIMGFHLLFFNLLNLVLFAVNNYFFTLPGFDADAFRNTNWYRWEQVKSFRFLYLIVGIAGPLVLKLAINKR